MSLLKEAGMLLSFVLSYLVHMLWPSSLKFCSTFRSGSGLKQLVRNRFDGRGILSASQGTTIHYPTPIVFTSLGLWLVFVYFMALFCLLLSPSPLPEKLELCEQKMLLLTQQLGERRLKYWSLIFSLVCLSMDVKAEC